MKAARSVRLSEDLVKCVEWLRRRRGGDASDAIRHLVRSGLEREVSDLYAQGTVSLREMGAVLDLPIRDCLDLLWQHGVTGNIPAHLAMEAASVIDELAKDSSSA